MLAPMHALTSDARAEEPAVAAAPAADEGPKISGVFGLDFNTHFISYGYDTWGVGKDFGEDKTLNPYAELKVDFTCFYFKIGTWWDVNSNVTSAIGGELQEVDVYYGIYVPISKFTFGFAYQDWNYGGNVEKVFDLSVSFDDTEWLGAFAMHPSFTAHKLSSGGEVTRNTAPGDIIKDSGWAYVINLAPGFTLMESKTLDLLVSFPITIAFGDGDFYDDAGFAYASVGVSLTVPLKFIPAKYGSWTISGGLAYYFTPDDALPNNPDEDFLTAKFGFSVGF
jgi:hypothetical protein